MTGKVFFAFKYQVFLDKNIEREFNNIIYGIGISKCDEPYMDEYWWDSENKLKKHNEQKLNP